MHCNRSIALSILATFRSNFFPYCCFQSQLYTVHLTVHTPRPTWSSAPRAVPLPAMAHTFSTAALSTLLCTLLASHSTAATRVLLQNSTAPAVEPIVNGGTFSNVPPGGFSTHLTFGGA